MSKFKATNRNNPCPVCEDVKGKCRILLDGGVLCMTSVDGYGMENHPKYRHVKPTKNGSWGTYYPRRDNDFDREQWLREKEARQVKQEETNQAALSIEVRNRDIRLTLNQLSLNDGDRRALYRRGFTDADIEKLGYKSVKQWQPLEGDLSYAVNRRGNLNNPTDGVIIPIPYFGQYQALRLHHPHGRPKYRSFKGSNLKSGEFPIAVYGHELAQGTTWATEGLEYKPARTYLRLQVPVIGHNGSNFTSSKGQVREALARLKTKTVIIAPDGGVVINPNLINQYREAIAFYRSLGYTVLIAWWGQFTKADGDIDEIADLSRIQYISPETFLSYCQGSHLGRFKDWVKKQIRPKPQGFKPVEGTPYQDGLLSDQLSQGKIVLDARPTGSGKTHSVADIAQKYLSENHDSKVFYLANDHRNPSVEAIADEFKDLSPRNKYGFYRDSQGKLVKADETTPQEWVTENGKCIKAPLFNQLSSLGYDPNQGGSENPICQSCPALKKCRFTEGWFLKERRETFSYPLIRGHIESMPRDYDPSRDLIIVEEPGQLLKPTKTIESNWAKILVQLDALRNQLSGEDYTILDRLMQTLKPLFSDKSKWGLNHQAILDTVGTVTIPPSIVEAIAATIPKLEDVFSVEADPRLTRSQVNFAQSILSSQELANVPPNALIHIVNALMGTPGTVLRIVRGNLTITLDRRSDYSPLFEKAGAILCLDATLDGDRLKHLLGVTRDIEVVTGDSPKITPHNNLDVEVILTKGLGSRDISDMALNRVYRLTQSLGDHLGNFPVIAPKHLQERLDIDGHWFNHNRGVNDFEGMPTLAYIGLPRPNLGMVEDEYLATQGTRHGFEDYYQTLIDQEIVQALGRPRANRYPDQKFKVIFIAPENTDLSWLSELGCKVTTKTSFEVNPLAGTETQATRWQILQTAQKLLAEGSTITQTAIAQALNLSQQAISKALVKAGVSLEWIVGKLFEISSNGYTTAPNKDHSRTGCIPEQLYDGFREFFELDPLLLAEDAIRTITERGLTYFWEEYLAIMPKPIQAKYLTALVPILWDDSEFLRT